MGKGEFARTLSHVLIGINRHVILGARVGMDQRYKIEKCDQIREKADIVTQTGCDPRLYQII